MNAFLFRREDISSFVYTFASFFEFFPGDEMLFYKAIYLNFNDGGLVEPKLLVHRHQNIRRPRGRVRRQQPRGRDSDDVNRRRLSFVLFVGLLLLFAGGGQKLVCDLRNLITETTIKYSAQGAHFYEDQIEKTRPVKFNDQFDRPIDHSINQSLLTD